MYDRENIEKIAKLLRYYALVTTTEAGSGHPTTALSATDLMATLMFSDIFKYDIDNPDNPNNDRLIFSKGHCSPLYYPLWAVAGGIQKEELMTLRKFGSRLEGHPTMEFPFIEVPTGSLGQGLAAGVGMAMNAKYIDELPYKTYVLLGDSEMAEGSNYEAMELAAYYELSNLVAVLDVNRLGQRGETMQGHAVDVFKKKAEAFGWHAIVIDGHKVEEIHTAYLEAQRTTMPTMIVAKTMKGKGISFLEDKNGWHGKPLSKEDLEKALKELGDVDQNLVHPLEKPVDLKPQNEVMEPSGDLSELPSEYTTPFATRKAYGNALAKMYTKYPHMVVLDAETSNSTYAEIFQKYFPQRFFEMFIAEQNMVGVASGFAKRGKIPFVSTFAAFFTRAHDQIRLAQYALSPLNVVGSHAGVSIGEDGSSQMGLEDIAMMRSILGSKVLYPSDATSCEKCVELMLENPGVNYLRTTRSETAPLYKKTDSFEIGGSKTLKSSHEDVVTVVAAGITLHEALKAYSDLQEEGIHIRVIDAYSVKPVDVVALQKAASETKAIITVEDHYAEGGLGEAVTSALASFSQKVPIHLLAVYNMPKSGKPQELLDYEEISAPYIAKKVKEVMMQKE